jgi:hypothetical protein
VFAIIKKADRFILEKIFNRIAHWTERNWGFNNFHFAWLFFGLTLLLLMLELGSGYVLETHTGGFSLDIHIDISAPFLMTVMGYFMYQMYQYTSRPDTGAYEQRFFPQINSAIRMTLIALWLYSLAKILWYEDYLYFFEDWDSRKAIFSCLELLTIAIANYFSAVDRPPPQKKYENNRALFRA